MRMNSVGLFVALAVLTIGVKAQILSPEMIDAGKRVDAAFDQNFKTGREHG